jgi:hypothetical protein
MQGFADHKPPLQLRFCHSDRSRDRAGINPGKYIDRAQRKCEPRIAKEFHPCYPIDLSLHYDGKRNGSK